VSDASSDTGRAAVVTGAARGIGFCVVQRLLAAGFDVAATDRDPAPAGIFHQTSALDMAERAMLEIMDVNLCGTLRCTSVLGGLMARGGGGRIIDIASISGVAGAVLGPAYAASKGAVIATTYSAARELVPHGIRVNVVAPAHCDTDMLAPQRHTVDKLVVPPTR
jgi:NAD(P)-dependent dehydrogenase (short-subunit alcohol dehydrogenase family)